MSLPRERSGPIWARKRYLAPLVLLVAIALLAACSDDDDPGAEPTTTRPTASTTTTSAQDEIAAQVASRYQRFWDIRLEVNRGPVNPDDPRLAELAVDPQLTQIVTETRQRRDQGLAIRPADASKHRVKVIGVDGDEASVQDCVTDGDVVYRVSSGETVDDKVVTRNVTATMRLVDGEWKLATTRVLQTWEGVAGCAKSSDS